MTRLPAYNGITATTGSAQLDQLDLNNGFPLSYGIFQDGLTEKLCFQTNTTDIVATTYTAQVEWTHALPVNTLVTWNIYAVRIPDDGSYSTTAIPLVATVSDYFTGTAYDKALSAASTAFAITGSGNTVLWIVTRDTGDSLVGSALYTDTIITRV
jgi:hypothetical protein